MNILLVSFGAYSQSCNCYIQNADSTFPLVLMSLGTDTGGAPHYRCNNCSSLPIKLPFSFCFYGKEYDTVYINNKGSLSFVNPVFNYSSAGLPAGNDTLLLSAFGADINNRFANSFSGIYYKITPTHMIAQWSTVGYSTFDDDLYNNFQVTITNGADSILPSGNNVSYCYWLMQWASGDSTRGTMGFAGLPAYIGVNKGDHVHYAQFGEFDFPGYSYAGPFDTNSGVYWLNGKSFIFNTCVSGNNIPPVIINPNSCDTISICAGDTALFTTSFLCPQQGQTATLSISSNGVSGLTNTTSNTNSIFSIKVQLIAALKDTGIHHINIVAKDNGSPSLMDSIPYTVIIKNCNIDTGTGINQIIVNNSVTIYPNPNSGKFTIHLLTQSGKPIVEIYNFLGVQVFKEALNNSEANNNISLTGQPSGLYFYRIVNESGDLMGNGKFVIQ